MQSLRVPEILLLDSRRVPGQLTWIDHCLEPESIIEAFSSRMDADDALECRGSGEQLFVEFNGKVAPIPLEGDRGDDYVTIQCIREAISDAYDVYIYGPSIGQTAHAFLIGARQSFQDLDARQARALARDFQLLEPGKDYFSGSLMGWPHDEPTDAELEEIHEKLFASLAPETQTGNPDPLDAIDQTPREQGGGVKGLIVAFLVSVVLCWLGVLLIRN